MTSEDRVSPDEQVSLVWLEQQARVVETLASLRKSGSSDEEVGEAIAATIAGGIVYALAFSGCDLGDVIARASEGLSLRLAVFPKAAQ